jgi:aminoglycoside 3'-phosphotransferase-1
MSHTDREEPCVAIETPASLAEMLAGYAWARDTVGESGGAVYRLFGRVDAPDLYLKHGCGPIAEDVTDEVVRLRWLAGRLPVPAVTGFVGAPGEAWLLMEAIAGQTAYQVLEAAGEDDQGAIVDALALHLKRLHAIPVEDCPFTSDHRFRLAKARVRLEAGLVDADDFDDERVGMTAQAVWDQMTALLPLAADTVVTHGDYSLDNLILRDGEVVGCIDVGRLGLADRYQDLAIAWNGLGEFGPSLQERFLKSYGIDQPDEGKLRFHLMLDEFF